MPKALPVLVTMQQQKPLKGKPCNHCGLCCSLCVCTLGIALDTNIAPNHRIDPIKDAPCKFLVTEGGKHTCGLYLRSMNLNITLVGEMLGIGQGCDTDDGLDLMEYLIE